jgi:predicted permease
VARLKPGVSIGQAAAQVHAISGRVAKEDPKNSDDWSGQVRPLTDRVIPKPARASAGAMFGAVGFVLLIACANVANLQLARGMMRRKEFALRASLGAARATLIRLQVAESLLLSLVGGSVAVLAAYWAVPMLKRVAPPEMRIFEQASVDLTTLGFALALSLLTGVLSGALPALLLTRGNLAEGLQEASRGSTGGRHLILKGLVVGEMTLALVLVTGGTMMIRSLIRQQTTNPGFDRTNLTAAHVLLPAIRYPESPQVAEFYSRALENLRRDNGVESAALVQTLPLAGDNSYIAVRVGGRSAGFHGRHDRRPGYFRTMRIPLIAGRDLAPGLPNLKAWPSSMSPSPAAIGPPTRFRSGGVWPVARNRRLTVVGVARDVRHLGISDPPRPEVHRPHGQVFERTMMLVARSRAGQGTAAATDPLFR